MMSGSDGGSSGSGSISISRNTSYIMTQQQLPQRSQQPPPPPQSRQYSIPQSPMLRRRLQPHQHQQQQQHPPPFESQPLNVTKASSSFRFGEKYNHPTVQRQQDRETVSKRIVDDTGSYHPTNLVSSSHHQQLYPTSLLLSPPRGIKPPESDGGSQVLSSFSPSYQPPPPLVRSPQPPFLTMVLMKIDQLLFNYCQYLSHPSHVNATLACCLFESMTGSNMMMNRNTAAKSSTICMNSNDKSTTAPLAVSPPSNKRWFPLHSTQQQQQQQQLRSPAAAASSLSSSASSSFPTQLALENEWETYVSPFLLFAAAEVLYAKFAHLQQQSSQLQQLHQIQQQQQQQYQYPTFFRKPNKENKSDDRIVISPVSSLIELYQRIDQDLQYIQEILCEPFLRSDSLVAVEMAVPPLPVPSATTVQHGAAISVTKSIRILSDIVSIRCQMITLQSLIFDVTCNDVGDIVDNKSVVVGDEESDDDENTNRLRSTSSTLIPTFYDAAGATTIWIQSVEATIASLSMSAAETRDDETQKVTVDNEKEPLAVLPLLHALQKELKTWKYCFETCAALERCKYVHTV